LLEKAKKEGDVLVVLVNNDDRVRAVKGESRPIVPEAERARVIAALECVDYVIVFDDKIEYMKRIKPDVHVKGGSVDPEKLRKEVDLVSSWGGKHRVLELEEGYSSTNIVDKILGRFK
jgi:rfaE bifunctional protein nucleotidyltransferase chain/domain